MKVVSVAAIIVEIMEDGNINCGIDNIYNENTDAERLCRAILERATIGSIAVEAMADSMKGKDGKNVCYH